MEQENEKIRDTFLLLVSNALYHPDPTAPKGHQQRTLKPQYDNHKTINRNKP